MTRRSRLASFAAVALGAAALAPSALAAGPTAPKLQAADNATSQPFPLGSLLGGGFIGDGGFFTDPTQTVGIRLSADRSQLNFYGVLEVICDDVTSRAASATGFNVPVGADGKFAGSVPYQTSGPGGSRSGTFSYSGKVTASGVASGTARLKMTETPNGQQPVDCDTDTFKWAARDAESKPGSGTLRKKASYYGSRSDTHVVAFRVDKDAKKVSSFVFDGAFAADQCSVGQPAVEAGNNTLINTKISNGKFSGKRHIKRSFADGDVTYDFKYSGKFGTSRATGTLSYKIEGFENGQRTSSCSSGSLTWKAER
jgi:hypothetical protein